jgi:ABC-2 type transport system permease protein
MRKLISIELYKIFTKPRTYIGFSALVIIILAIEAGVYYGGDEMIGMIIQNISERFIFEGEVINVYLISYLVLNTLWIHVPILVALVTGDLLAGEANSGTFRILLTRPVSRVKLVLAKFLSGWIYTLLLIVSMIVLSIGIGSLLFGKGDLMVITNKVNFFSSDDLLWRFGLAYAYGLLSMTTVISLSFMLSSMAENSIGPIIGTIALIIGITIISTVGASLLKGVNKYLFTTYLPSWQLFFETEIKTGELFRAVMVQLAYIIVFMGSAITIFRKKDILS